MLARGFFVDFGAHFKGRQEDFGGTRCVISNKSKAGALEQWILAGGIRLTY